MPGNRAQLRLVHAGDGVGQRGHVSAADAVRADLERVLALDLEQVGDLAEHLRDRRGYPRASPWRSMREVEQPRAAAGQRVANRLARARRAVAEQAAAAAGAAHLGGGRAGGRARARSGRRWRAW